MHGNGAVGVDSDAYYAKAFAWAYERGLLDEEFANDPDATCGRAEAVMLLHKYDGIASAIS